MLFTPPCEHGGIAADVQAEPSDKISWRVHLKQLAHARLRRGCQIEEALQHGAHQHQAVRQRHRTERLALCRATCQAKRQPGLLVQVQGRQPQVMRVLEHRQALACIQLHSELGRQLVKARGAFQQIEDLPGQRPGVQQHERVMPGQWAEHHVAHIVTRGVAWSQAGCEQCLDQSAMLAANAANLQVATVGGLDHAASKTLRRRRHGFGLLGQQQATRQLDAADTAITGTDNAPQPRTGRGAGRYVGAWACVKGASGSL